jgi:3-deoxy-D-manno-octulosonic-acid transferase
VRWLYSLIFYLATPLIAVRLLVRGRSEPAYRLRWRERLAIYANVASQPQGVIWLHAVSVGEAEAAFPLLRLLAKRHPEIPILVTTTTPTGSARIIEVLGNAVAHVYLPYDLPDAVARFLNHFRPRLAVMLETEIWPNFFHACGKRDIPLAIVNACLSKRSTKGYQRLGSFTRSTLSNVGLVAAQTQLDAERFIAIGSAPSAVQVLGSIKFDLQLPEDYWRQGANLRQLLFGGRKVWIAASTHQGEEELLLKAFAEILAVFPGCLLVLVPRHPHRCDEVERLCLARGLPVARRSSGQGAENKNVFLVDTLGELRTFYAAADLAFVGGSLVPVGGHNILEPALAGLPILLGPNTEDIADVLGQLLEAGGALQVRSADELPSLLLELWRDEKRCKAMAEAGREFVEARRGVVELTVDALDRLLA